MPRLALLLTVPLGLLWAQDEAELKHKQKAAREAAKLGKDGLAQLAPLLEDADALVRVEAVKALVEIGTQYSLDPLVRAARDNDAEVQIRAVEGIVNFYLPGYAQSGISGSLRRAGNRVMGKFTDTNTQVVESYVVPRADAIEVIARLASGGSSMESRAAAARAAGVLRGRAAVDSLLEGLRTKDDRLMYESLVALQKIREERTAARVLFLFNDPNERVRIAAIELTGMLRAAEAVRDLRRTVEQGQTIKTRRAALGALAMIPDAAHRELYRQMLADKDEGIRAGAAEGLARIRDQADQEALSTALTAEKKTGARLSICFALAMLGALEVGETAPLRYMVDNLNSRSYRGVAEPFLSEIARSREGRAALYPLLQTGSKNEKGGLARALAASGAADAVEPLDALTKDADTEVAAEAIRALRNLKARLP